MTKQLLVIMGPSGSGKSFVANALAEAIAAPMLEGDDFHPQANLEKMASSTPLNDTDRALWIDRMLAQIRKHTAPVVVLACSALTGYVQDRLSSAPHRHTRFIVLEAPRNVLEQRMTTREGHFMPPSLLDSQIEALSLPEDALRIDACQPLEAIIAQICAALGD